MSSELISLVGIAGLFVLLLLGVPIAFALALIAFIGYMAISGAEPALSMTGMILYSKLSSYTLAVVPLFVLMGHFTYFTGFVADIFKTARLWVAHVPGGLAQSTVVAAAAFGAACGSSIAACATLSRIAVPEMVEAGVDRRLAYGTVAASATLAVMIPPSILMVIYGLIAEQSIGKLLIAGILPGIVAAANYMIMIYIRAKRNPHLAPVVKGVPWKERIVSLRGTWGIAAIALVVMGGIYTGIFTPTEAGGVGAFAVFVMAIARRRLGRTNLRTALMETGKTVGMIYLIVGTALFFGYFLSIGRTPVILSEFLLGLQVHPLVVLIGIMLMYVVLGCFLDMLAIMFITLPIILPAINGLGFDPIWFGVLIIQTGEIALVTPPFGLNLFAMKSVLPDVDLGDIITGYWPFFIVDLITLAIYVAFPQIALFLPQRMMGG
ncbi:MAG: TRAP transporter large permease [Chloroflexi bacterium]|nr:TRAP transporter large permease [Chloroflexota bacterium]